MSFRLPTVVGIVAAVVAGGRRDSTRALVQRIRR
jgi:hypothetical protein